MVSAAFYFLAFLGIVISPQKVGDELDEATNARMRRYAEEMQERMAQLLLEIEALEKQQSSMHMGALLLSAMQTWQFWASLGFILLLIWLLFWLRKKFEVFDDSSDEESSSSDEDLEEPALNDESNTSISIAESIQRQQVNLTNYCRLVEEMVRGFCRACDWVFKDTFSPVLQTPIGVGSAFEGWSPREGDTVYRCLIPMTAPRGHSFHVEQNTKWNLPSKVSRIRVKLECTCWREQEFGNMLCFLHNPVEELRRNQEPSLLRTMCTRSYLDVRKVSSWFQQLAKLSWKSVPHSSSWLVKVLKTRRSCMLRLIDDTGSTVFVEMMFGVQQGDTDIFLSSDYSEAPVTPDTVWPQSCAVAEMKFFRNIAANAQQDSFHLGCMQLCARIALGSYFTSYMMKTVVMHLLNTIPLERWHRREFLQRMDDIMEYLCSCLRKKCLDHFWLGNEQMPEEFILPPDFQTSRPPNLFQHMAKDPDQYTQAHTDFHELQEQLMQMLNFGN
ncbi:inositol 1,4,5-trisphosphate receptor-interacting protein-like 1 [Anas platyrhynchos]|uniref:inositol 1,4,5-trisphosphate receptor-interacting protein-like 1 n=1 Tax=Anas platyrhynchos TaxID=8839 RepID=UPI0018D730E2|nr:inositol 1,4,5-trisphosphate receptor-interacting protein-like 1 [Anas platyrhynchos]XP_038036359.1 inositol 1,4,5-trisphosphate receptor-interacting protein-like 1 [Anas platyrhynchos]